MLRGVEREHPAWPAIVLIGLLVAYHLTFRGYLPTPQGTAGGDYALFASRLLAGTFWFRANGLGAIPWFTPAFCAGVPFFADPQTPYVSLLQLYAFGTDPLGAAYLTLLTFAGLGFAGCYVLLRHSFGTSQPAALLAATLFMWNGFFSSRMLIGHVTFHAFMLLPGVAALLLHRGGPRSRLGFAAGVALAGAALGYGILSGMVHALAPLLVAVIAIGIVHGARHGLRRWFWLGLGLAILLGGALGAAKLVAGASYLAQFPRDYYQLSGTRTLWDAIAIALRGLFGRPREGNEMFLNLDYQLERHEFEYGLTPVALVAMLGGAIAWLWRARRQGGGLGLRPVEAAALLAILIAPVVLNWYEPHWNRFLKQLPLIRSTFTLLRWLCVYVPLGALAAGLALEHTAGRHRWPWALAGIGLTVALHAATDRSFYAQQWYDARPVIAASGRRASPPPIERVGSLASLGPNDGLVQGISSMPCIEPMFGYRLERFPLGPLRGGRALDEKDGLLNLKNPACYVFPAENACAPGDHFRAEERAAAEAFLRYQPFPFRLPARQRIANAVSVAALLGILAVLGWWLARRVR